MLCTAQELAELFIKIERSDMDARQLATPHSAF